MTKKENQDSDDIEIYPERNPPMDLARLSHESRQKEKTRDGLLHVLDDSFSAYENIQLTEAETATFSRTIKRLSTGSGSFSVLQCHGAECSFASRCPLVQMKTPNRDPVDDVHGKAPVGQSCILETTLYRDSLTSYIQEYEVDPANYTEVNIVSELAEIETLLWRCNMQISDGASLLVIDQTIGFDRASGRPITQQQVAPIFEQKQKLASRKSKLMKLMVGDRQEKYKKEAALKQKPTSDASSSMSEIKRQLQALQNRLNSKPDEKVIEAKIISPEEFILQQQQQKKEGDKP